MIRPENLADAVFLGVSRQLLTESSLRIFAQRCPIHGEPYQVAHKPGAGRCAKCLEAIRDETWPEPTTYLELKKKGVV